MIEKKGTCKSCGYEMKYCICGKKKNSSGDVQLYQNYNDYREASYQNYAVTSKINRTTREERKIMEELSPVDGELLSTYLKRTEIAEHELIQYSIHYHLYGTRKGAWACHTGSRYCFICSTAQYLNVNRAIYENLSQIVDLTKIIIHITHNEDEIIPLITLTLPDD